MVISVFRVFTKHSILITKMSYCFLVIISSIIVAMVIEFSLDVMYPRDCQISRDYKKQDSAYEEHHQHQQRQGCAQQK